MSIPSESTVTEMRLLGQDWIDHGYQPDVIQDDEIEPCIICGVENNLCTGKEHGNGTQ